jgi:hypothetical protein
MAIRPFSEYLADLMPTRLRTPTAARLVSALGGMFDGLRAGLNQAARARMVTRTPADGLPYIGSDRGLDRAEGESFDAWRAALVTAWDTWELAGTNTGILAALQRALPGDWRIYESFDWPGSAPGWATFWVVLEPPHELAADGPWGAPGDWGDGGVWGSIASQDQVARVLRAVRIWKPAHTKCAAVIVIHSGDVWGNDGDWGDPGDWGDAVASYWIP